MRVLIRTLLLLGLVLPTVAADCSGPATPPVPEASSPPTASGEALTPTAPPGTATPAASLHLEVWFERGGKLFETTRTVPHTLATGRAALMQLLAGPTDAERTAGVSSRIAAGTTITSLTIRSGVASVRFSTDLGSDRMSEAQIVYTLTQFPTIQGVEFSGQEGVPLRRHDFVSNLPPIVVASPAIGAHVVSPVRVSGTADVFEATVSIRILDQNGRPLADTFATASCGSGCRGTYSRTVTYSLSTAQPGTIVVFEANGETGQPTHVQKIPVFLSGSP